MPRPSVRPRLARAAAVALALLVLGAGALLRVEPARAAGPLGVSVSMRSEANVGVPYTVELAAIGGQAPYTWSLVSGSLPPGLSLSPSGEVTGTPQPSDAPSTFTVRVVDALGQVGESTITLQHATRWTPPGNGQPQPDILDRCDEVEEMLRDLGIGRLCDRYQSDDIGDLTRYIIGAIIERIDAWPSVIWAEDVR